MIREEESENDKGQKLIKKSKKEGDWDNGTEGCGKNIRKLGKTEKGRMMGREMGD